MEGENGDILLTKNSADLEENSNTENDNSVKPLTHSTPVVLNGGFNTDEFLARINMNSKINNILRSPPKTPTGIRQRSVYTTSSQFNAGAAPFVSQQQHHHQRNAESTASMASFDMGPRDTSTPTGHMVSRQLPLTMSPHPYCSAGAGGGGGGYDSPITSRSNISRNSTYLYNTRYPFVAHPSPIYECESDAYRMPPSMSPQHHAQQLPQPMPPPPFVLARLNSNHHRAVEYEHPTPPTVPCTGAGPIAMTNGTIQLRLRDGIRIDMTLDKAVRVLNQRSMVAIGLSSNSNSSALIHPNGRVLQSGTKVELVTYDGMKTNNYVRYAKMWYKGVSFTSETCALIYLVDTAGTRTTTDTFTDLTKDYTLTVFYDNSRHGPSYVQAANEVIQNATYSCTDDGTETYDINGFRITQAADGLVKLTRTHNKCLIRTSPGNGSATLTTMGIHCTASLGKTSHLFVRRNEKRMHFDGSSFIVRNAGHSAGFNEDNLLIVY
ncbi:uncharacterized protein LOC133335353 [Musca vetustissima]|uniref:uncharacterized protein LOC133335353 n=1 Tax=Musca vetustissima TaxID=27455 RepID=UPI002AB78096|nr:uncharacterized protein LOC133335353 [Musca vetustissima]